MSVETESYADVLDRVAQLVREANYDLGRWDRRDVTGEKPEAEKRAAANEAMRAVDLILMEMNAVRARLVSEVRAQDDAFEAHPARASRTHPGCT